MRARLQINKELVRQHVPPALAEKVYDRVSPLLEQYHHDQAFRAGMLKGLEKGQFDLKSLCISCYTQGLMDAQQLNPKEVPNG